MVSDISVGLAQLRGDFFERMPFEEVQSKRFPLIFGQRLDNPLPPISSEEPFDGLVIVCATVAVLATFNRLVCNSGQIKPVRLQLPPAQEGLSVGNLDDPGTGRTFRLVK